MDSLQRATRWKGLIHVRVFQTYCQRWVLTCLRHHHLHPQTCPSSCVSWRWRTTWTPGSRSSSLLWRASPSRPWWGRGSGGAASARPLGDPWSHVWRSYVGPRLCQKGTWKIIFSKYSRMYSNSIDLVYIISDTYVFYCTRFHLCTKTNVCIKSNVNLIMLT